MGETETESKRPRTKDKRERESKRPRKKGQHINREREGEGRQKRKQKRADRDGKEIICSGQKGITPARNMIFQLLSFHGQGLCTSISCQENLTGE